jgi:hypothetical protein
MIVQRVDEFQSVATRNLDRFGIAAPGRCQHDFRAGAIGKVVQQRDQILSGPNQTPSRIGFVCAIENAVYVDENYPHVWLLIAQFILTAVSGAAWNVEVGSAAFLHHQKAAREEQEEYRADDCHLQHVRKGTGRINRSRPG